MVAVSPSHPGSEQERTVRQDTPRAGRPATRGKLRWRLLSWAFLALVAGLILRQGLAMDWRAVGRALAAVAPPNLALAALLAALSHALYASFDLIGRHQTGHRLPPAHTLAVGFTSYAFNLNFGALIGGIGFRFRLYAQYGLRPAVISQVLALSVITNWIGYCLIGGILFLVRPPALPPDWAISGAGLRAVGAMLLFAVAAYLILCASVQGRTLRLRGRSFHLPGVRLALLQFVVSSCNWIVAAGIVYVLLDERVNAGLVLGSFLAAAIAGAVAHVPAGLGVLEAVFVALLGHLVPVPTILAVLLAYRAVYYLAPLAAACVLLLVSRKARRARRARMSSSVRA